MNMKKILLVMAVVFYIGGFMELSAQGPMQQNGNGRPSRPAEYSGGVLTPKQEALCRIAAFTARGDMPSLEQALNTGFDAGLTINEAREAVVQLYAYCGFPRCLNSLSAVGRVLEDRGKQGKPLVQGRNNTLIPGGKTSYDIGSENQLTLFNMPQGDLLTRNAPSDQIVNYYLRAHLFGDIFARDILDWPTRELVTISALSAMQGVEGQLGGHQAGGVSAGLTQEQVNAIGTIVQKALSTGNEQRIIRRPDMTAGPGGNDHFTGDVVVRFIYMPDSETNVSAAYVTFEPGARSNWHIHGTGQRLVITEGVCWTQNEDGSKVVANAGDVVICPAGVKHWHGASPDSWMTHLALTGSGVEWLERVTDEQYLGN
jgi:quercetin dioxygenase-like cupin family protein/alkylhydroperoxidase/carboxymuconolactone decarboxylase family protein YurZ